jgi:hypothetical protein
MFENHLGTLGIINGVHGAVGLVLAVAVYQRGAAADPIMLAVGGAVFLTIGAAFVWMDTDNTDKTEVPDDG